jgi:hypothetical protein
MFIEVISKLCVATLWEGVELRLWRQQKTGEKNENKQLKIPIFVISAVAVIKSKYRSKMNVEKEMHFAVPKMLLRFEVLCHGKRAHRSH